MPCPLNISTELQLMHDELESQRLTVVLFPAPRPAFEGHMIRVPIEANTAWYRKMCQDYAAGAHRTKVRRNNILRVLKRLAAGQRTTSHYATYLLKTARARLENNPF